MSDSHHLSILPQRPLLEGKNSFVQLVFLVLFVLLGTIVFSSAGLLVSYLIWGANVAEHPTADYYRLLQAFNAVGTFLIPALLLSYALYHRWFTYSQADCAVNDARKYLYVSLLSIFLIPVVGLVATLNGMIHLPDFLGGLSAWMAEVEAESNSILETIIGEKGARALLLNILICAVFPAVCEEFFFRGTLQPFFRNWFRNKHAAVWVTAFIFSAIHLQFSGFFARLLLGAYLGYLFVWSGSLWLPILAHLLHNTLSIVFPNVIAYFDLPISENASLLQQLPLALMCIIISVGLILMLYRRRI
ncbi:MAG: CPBP family intramembrane metalloprotease [Bacteroidales bacterium]|nr:CPBP family intramembrane metalloprotease [Bacteroidales bacterium]